jgi:hypothetical protein
MPASEFKGKTETPLSYRGLCQRQVQWYLRCGRYGEARIATDGSGIRYVIGDWSWNRSHPDKQESIEGRRDFQQLGDL